MGKKPEPLERLRRICLALPDTHETLTWGEPHFRVRDKIFCGFGEEAGRPMMGYKVTMDHQDALIMREGFRIAKYVGRYGWVSMDITASTDWGEVEDLVRESYELIAPKKSLARIAGPSSSPRPRKPSRGASKRTRTNTKRK